MTQKRRVTDLDEEISPAAGDFLLLVKADGAAFKLDFANVGSGGGGGSVAWSDVTGKPTFAAVATSGDYNDLTNLPSLFSGAYSDLSGKPSLFSGEYADLTGKPALFSGNYADLSGKPTLGTASALNVGSGASEVVQLDGSAKLPAVDGSQLTNLPAPSSVFSFCQVRNTDDTTNINAAASNLSFGGTTDATNSDYTLASNNITVNFDGTVNVQAHISQTSTDPRTNVGIYITKNFTRVSGVGQSGYIRAAVQGHNESSSHISATFDVSSGDVIRVAGVPLANSAGTVNQIAGESQVTVERRA